MFSGVSGLNLIPIDNHGVGGAGLIEQLNEAGISSAHFYVYDTDEDQTGLIDRHLAMRATGPRPRGFRAESGHSQRWDRVGS